jgi:proteasome lid subunit RPN8/RPN11
LFRVKIVSSVLNKIMEHVNQPYEQIGLLIGEVNGGMVIIKDAIRGEGSADSHHSIFSPQSLAKVANDLISGKLQGRIVGWYHSHIGCGVFMSDVDVKTQMILQQFSEYVISLVIDSKSGEFAVYTYSQPFGIVQIPEQLLDF